MKTLVFFSSIFLTFFIMFACNGRDGKNGQNGECTNCSSPGSVTGLVAGCQGSGTTATLAVQITNSTLQPLIYAATTTNAIEISGLSCVGASDASTTILTCNQPYSYDGTVIGNQSVLQIGTGVHTVTLDCGSDTNYCTSGYYWACNFMGGEAASGQAYFTSFIGAT